MPLPAWLTARAEGELTLSVRLQPRASRNEILYSEAGPLRVRVMAPPVDHAANAALIKFLASAWGLRKSSVRITAGLKSRNKTVSLFGLTATDLISRFPADLGNDSPD